MTESSESKINIRLESVDHEVIILAYYKILSIMPSNIGHNIKYVSLPTAKRIYCVLRSPHVDKDSREHFEVRIHKRMIEISYPSTVDFLKLLLDLDLPSGISYKIIVY